MSKDLLRLFAKSRPDFSQLRKVLFREGKPDYVPLYELSVGSDVMEAALGKKVEDAAATMDFYYSAGYDYVPVAPIVDFHFGSLVDRSQGYPISDWESFENHPWPKSHDVSYANFESVAAILPDGMKIIGQTSGILEAVESLVGYEQMCYLLFDAPALIEAILERISEVYNAMYKNMADHEQVGAVVISDDMGFKTQTLIGATDLKKYILPRHKQLTMIAHNVGKPCVLHSCGQLSSIMEDIITFVGIDAKHSYEDCILPVVDAKHLYGDRIAILGGFDLDRLCRSDEQSVREYTRMLIETLGASGGYAIGSGNSIPGFVPLDNYLAMLDEAWQARTS